MDMYFENIKKLRKLNGMTQWELGEKLGISASAVGMYEQGRREPDSKTLLKLSEIFSVSVDEILNGKKTKDIVEYCDDFLSTFSKKEFTLNGESLTQDEISSVERAVKFAVEISVQSILKEKNSGR